MTECHQCHGTGKDQDAVNATSFPNHCTNCHGTGAEPEGDTEDDCPICFGTGEGEGIDWHCHACSGTGRS